ncbi:MAG: AAA domain-containing protein, partial [Pseudonocardiaceae bacterium]
VNMGLLGMKWFSPESLASAAAIIAGQAWGFGQATAVVDAAKRLLNALEVPTPALDPTNLIDFAGLSGPWRPQEVGAFNMVMAFKGELDAATRSLVKDLGWMVNASDWRDSAARFLFEDAPVPPVSLTESCAVTLNDSQEIALAWAATAPLTVITGPPGTGKSQTVTAILAEAWRRGQTALLSSTNNTPVDDVIDNKAAMVDEALVLRTGNVEKWQQLRSRLGELVCRVAARAVDPAASSLTQATLARHQVVHLLQLRAEVARDMLHAAVRRDEARAELWDYDQRPPDSMRALIRTRATKAARTWWGWLRRRRTSRLLELAGITNSAVTVRQVLEWADSEDAFNQAEQRLSAFQHTNPHDLGHLFGEENQRWKTASIAAVRNRVRDGFATGAKSLINLADTLTEDLPRREAIEQAMAHAKGWATSALSTRPNFDCRAGVIDLVVIDEASQCNLAQVLPLAYRAKRLVIVGDPQQLSPVVTANAEELRALAIAAGTSHDSLRAAHHTYGEDSAYTAFAARFHPTPLLLDEHYRCHPEIIRYCNEQFYENKLTILTSVNRDGDPSRGLEWHEVIGRTEAGRTGSALNHAEADAVVTWVLACGLPPERIGVVTPFRAQAARIRELLAQRGHGEFAAVRVGTAHTFQGGERDTIVFSTVISTGAMPGTIAWLEGERNLINVAVSRARQHLVVFGNSAELRRAGAKTLLGLVTAADGAADQSSIVSTMATRKLHAALVASGLPASLGVADEGYSLAITLTAINGDRINVEVEEHPDGDLRGRRQRQLAIRDANIRRLGWQILRVPGWQAYLNPGTVVEQVRQLVTR